jgi:hypothetical protein
MKYVTLNIKNNDMSNFLKFNIAEAKKMGFLTYFNDAINEHKKLNEILLKYKFSSISFKN